MPALAVPSRFAVLTIGGAAALSLAALSLPAPAHAQGDGVFGPITSVSGNTFDVAGATGIAPVAFSDSTTIGESIPALRTDVTVGSCIKAGPGPDGGPAGSDAITANWVMIGTAIDGKCPQRPGSANPAPPAQHRGVSGVVSSVDGDTVTVNRQDGAPATVTVTDATHFKKRVPTDAQAITPGKCVAARGAKDSNGVLQATRVTVWASSDGHCPQPPGQ